MITIKPHWLLIIYLYCYLLHLIKG